MRALEESDAARSLSVCVTNPTQVGVAWTELDQCVSGRSIAGCEGGRGFRVGARVGGMRQQGAGCGGGLGFALVA